MSVKDDSSSRPWQSLADEWVSRADTSDYRNAFLMPTMLAMMDEVAGLLLLDLGCGESGYGRELAKRGAIVVGVDGSL